MIGFAMGLNCVAITLFEYSHHSWPGVAICGFFAIVCFVVGWMELTT